MPSLRGTGTSVTPQIFRLLRRRHLRRFAGIEAHRDDLKLLPHIELQHAERTFETAKDFSAQHRALVIDQIQDDRLLAEVIPQANCFAGFVAEREIERNLLIQMLLDANVFQTWWPYV